MKTLRGSKTMQSVIQKLAAKHGLDLTANYAHLRLEMPNYMPLVIEKIGPNKVSVCHYREESGEAIQNPEVVFYTGYAEAIGWVPVEIQQPPLRLFGRDAGGYEVLVEFGADGRPCRFYPAQQADVTSFCCTWAKNIRDQGWLARAEKVDEKNSPAALDK